MTTRDGAELPSLAALRGGSFLFMRRDAAEFGPFALVALRVSGTSLLLLPLLARRGQMADLRRHWRPIFVVGVVNSVLPFVCLSFAALSITAGLSSILNATAPLAVVAAGSQVAAALSLALPGRLWWPDTASSNSSWFAIAMLALPCTVLAYLLYFQLIAHVDPANAIAVTYLIPLFAVLWGSVFLGEAATAPMPRGGAAVLLGTAMATAIVRGRWWSSAANVTGHYQSLKLPESRRAND